MASFFESSTGILVIEDALGWRFLSTPCQDSEVLEARFLGGPSPSEIILNQCNYARCLGLHTQLLMP